MYVDPRLAPTAPYISIGKFSRSSHTTLLSSKSINSVFVAEFNGDPVDINILDAVKKALNEIQIITHTYSFTVN